MHDRMLQVNRLDWFSVFKYLVYAALVANVALFFKEDWEAASHVFQDGVRFAQIIEGFAPSIDTAAWVILLLLFELETCQLSDEVLKRPIGLAIRACAPCVTWSLFTPLPATSAKHSALAYTCRLVQWTPAPWQCSSSPCSLNSTSTGC